MRRKSETTMPYLLLTGLLYGKFAFLERPSPGVVVVEIRPLLKHFGIDRKSFHAWVGQLAHLNLLSFLKHKKGRGWLIVKTALPAGMRYETEEPLSPLAIDGELL